MNYPSVARAKRPSTRPRALRGGKRHPCSLVATARGLGAGPLALYVEVIVPGAAPALFTGLSIGMGTAWFCLVTAEMIAGQFGIGYFTWESYTLQNYADIIVGMGLIGVLGMASSLIVKRIGLASTPWYRLRGVKQ